MATETATAAAEEGELKTYWCHECDMSVALTSSPSPSIPLLCPHCHTHFLELMDSPTQNDAVPPPLHSPSSLSFFDSPFLHRLIHRHNDVVLEDPLSLLLPPNLPSETTPSKPSAVLPVVTVTSSLLLQLDPNGVVSCAVCKDEIEVDVEAKQLPCKHLYHADCITPWLDLHDSCPLCRFRLTASAAAAEEDEEEGDDGGLRSSEIRRQLRAAMVRLSELMDEEEDDFYGLRTTLNHIATRHGLIGSSDGSRVTEGEGGGSESVSRLGGGE